MMIEVQEGQALSADDAWINHAQILAVKLFKQACSVRVVVNTTQLDFQDGKQIVFVDHCSATILARACLETFIVFHLIFQSKDPALRRFKHGVWRLGGLMGRLKLHPSTEQARATLQTTRLQAAEQIAEIEASPYLGDYKPEQAKRLLKGEWRVGWSWTDKAVRAGFNKKYFQNVYSHFCGYADSSYISSMQMGEAQSMEYQRMQTLVALQTSVHVMARTVAFYVELFPIGRAVLESAPAEAQKAAYFWGFTSENMDHLFDGG